MTWESRQDPDQCVFQLRIELADVSPPVWRRILVPGTVRLAKLSDMLQAAMGWTNSHLHAFEVGDKRFGMCLDDDPDDEIDEKRVSVVQALTDERPFLYEYDFGDGWEHRVDVEEQIWSYAKLKLGVCLAGENACPPEDVGGPGGYALFLEAMGDPKHAEHDDFVRWIGGSFDARAFDLVEANAALQRIR